MAVPLSLATIAQIAAWTALYYAASAASGIWNKALVDGGAVSVTVLTLLHLLVSLGSDIAIMKNRKETGGLSFPPTHGRHSLRDIVLWFTPISVFVISSKLTTYLGYQHVSVALSHTAKASEPIFNVLVAGALFKEFHSAAVYISLAPIASGVILASVNDFSYNHIGFFWSVLSALMKVIQNIYTKKVADSKMFTFWEMHLYCGAAATIILVPVLAVQGIWHQNPFKHFPIASLFMCSLLQYVSSIASYKVLHLVTHLTFTIVNVMKRLFIIVAGVYFAQQSMSVLNAAGVIVAVGGILCYSIVKDVDALGGPANVWSLPSWLSWLGGIAAKYNHSDAARPSDLEPPRGAVPLLPLSDPLAAPQRRTNGLHAPLEGRPGTILSSAPTHSVTHSADEAAAVSSPLSSAQRTTIERMPAISTESVLAGHAIPSWSWLRDASGSLVRHKPARAVITREMVTRVAPALPIDARGLRQKHPEYEAAGPPFAAGK